MKESSVKIPLSILIQSCQKTVSKLFISELSFPGRAMVKNLPSNVGNVRDMGLIPASGRSPGVGNSNPLQYSSLENSMDRGS